MPDTAELLVIVRPGADERFRLLEETFTGLPVRVMWDRRGGEAYYYLALAGLPRTAPTDEVVPERGVATA